MLRTDKISIENTARHQYTGEIATSTDTIDLFRANFYKQESGCSPIREEVFVEKFENDSDANLLDSDEELNDDKSFVVANKRLPKNYGKEITLNFGNKPIMVGS